jgi:hypothetical protein
VKGLSDSKSPTKATLIRETLELMRITAHTEPDPEEEGCSLWTGALSSRSTSGGGGGGYPIMKVAYGCPCMTVRRVLVTLFGDKDGNRELAPRQPVEVTCGNRLCVDQAHLVVSTAKRVGVRAAKRGAFSSPARGAKIAAARRGAGKLNEALAAEIRMSKESGPVLAKRHNVNKSLINGIKRGTAWKDYSNPFMQLVKQPVARGARA